MIHHLFIINLFSNLLDQPEVFDLEIIIPNKAPTTLKKEKLTTRDSRSVERKKYGHRKARRSFQFSKR